MRALLNLTNKETLVPENTFIYSRTDTKGRITEAIKPSPPSAIIPSRSWWAGRTT